MNGYLEILRDPIWQSAGVVVALIIGAMSIRMGYLAVRNKSITYEINSKNKLASIKDDLNGRVTVLFDGKQVNNPQLVVLTITNTGHIPVASSDFETAISVKFGKEIKILTCSIEKQSPKSLPLELKKNNLEIIIQPLLLNPKDYFSIKVLLAGKIANPVVTARIHGVQEISEHHLTNVKAGKVILGFAILMFAVTSGVYFGIALLGKDVDISIFEVLWINSGIFAVIAILAIFFPNRFQDFIGNGYYPVV